LPARNVAAADALVGGSKPLLALSPAAGWRVKEWPVERFAEIAMRLTGAGGALAGGSTIVLAGENERDKATALLDLLPPRQRIAVIGEADLLTVGAILARSSLFIGNDSGLAHLAAASGSPTLGLFGPTSATIYRPWGPRAAFVQTAIPYEELLATFRRTRDNHVSLMGSLSVDAVEAAARRLLAPADSLSV
jgi:lipopolysaccharide export system permease protein